MKAGSGTARFGLAGLALAASIGAALAQSAPLEKLTIDTATGAHGFKVEVMRTEPERERGLMYRKTMPRDHGMLFQYPSEQPVTFWMHNTYLPLDMIFIDKAGRVVSVARDAKPMDDTLIPSEGPALGVLEVDAGVAASIGLKPGDVVHHAMFGAPAR